jgi:hypothetical protein
LAEAWNSRPMKIENSGIEGDGLTGRHERDHNTADMRAGLLSGVNSPQVSTNGSRPASVARHRFGTSLEFRV